MNNREQELAGWITGQLGIHEYELSIASEDASFRRYYRIIYKGVSKIIMDAPVENENCDPFIDISRRLRDAGVNVPEVLHMDLNRGFILLTDLGNNLYLDTLADNNVDLLYADALESLFRMQKYTEVSGLPEYDEKLLCQEMELFRDWLLKEHLGFKPSADENKKLDKLFKLLVENALIQPQVFVHRDYHSRNLMVLSENNPGIIDYQDAVKGPITYDLVSLLKDCYIKWPGEKIKNWTSNYYQRFYPDLTNTEQLMRWFDLMGVQRQLKASGIFARLFHRDGKSGYIKDIPRTLSYITDIQHEYPELSHLADIINNKVLPGLTER